MLRQTRICLKHWIEIIGLNEGIYSRTYLLETVRIGKSVRMLVTVAVRSHLVNLLIFRVVTAHGIKGNNWRHFDIGDVVQEYGAPLTKACYKFEYIYSKPDPHGEKSARAVGTEQEQCNYVFCSCVASEECTGEWHCPHEVCRMMLDPSSVVAIPNVRLYLVTVDCGMFHKKQLFAGNRQRSEHSAQL